MRYILFFSGLITLFSACVVPVQMPRVTLVESYIQNFDFGTIEDKSKLTTTLGLLIGSERVDQLITSDEGIVYIERMKEEKIISKGITTLTFSLVPNKKPASFYISGNGSYNIVDTTSAKVYFSAQFYVIDTIHYPISILDTASTIPIYFNQTLYNHISYEETHSTWEHKPAEHVRIDAAMNRKIMDAKGKPIFGIDYSANHRISISGKTIGSIKFRAPQSPFDKIIDMRGMKSMIRRDYHKFKAIYEKE